VNSKDHILIRRFRLPILRTIEDALRSLSLSGKLIFYILSFIFIVSGITLLAKVNNAFLVEVPETGGVLHEGVVGFPRFVNPVLGITDGDKDLIALLYSGLMRSMPDGRIIPDLAESYTISPDGTVYTFKLRQNAKFHDGTPVTADDVVFTVEKVLDPMTKSAKRANWDGVSAEKVNDYEVKFTLKQAYAPFLSNTTLGILPRHLWQGLQADAFEASDYNKQPIGSGPYKLLSIERNENGVPLSYELASNDEFVLGKPYIKRVQVKFYTSEKNLVEAYQAGDIDDINSISPLMAEELKNKGANIKTATLPRIFAIFFNQNNNKALTFKEVRQALSMSVDRNQIIDSVLGGFGLPLDSAAPSSFTSKTKSRSTSETSHLDQAIKLLDEQGWKLNEHGIREKKVGKDTIPLTIAISTSDAEELKAVADRVKNEWQKLGADVSVKIVEGGYLNQNVIRPRKYEALLFGQVINRDLDLYAFWHSSQVSDPGLNVALYESKVADGILESLRTTTDRKAREDLFEKLRVELAKDIPAVFLYTPQFIYVVSPHLAGIHLEHVAVPSDRFGDIVTWYLTTDRVWKIFAHTTNQ
jgi:peptide/nickel transport system substrate-binding protein